MRKFKTMYGTALILALVSCHFSNDARNKKVNRPTVTTSAATGKYNLAVAFPGVEFEQPVELTSPNDNTDRIFVVAQKGIIHVLRNKPDVKNAQVFLDI